MNDTIDYTLSEHVDTAELLAFYQRQQHATTTDAAKLEKMVERTSCFVSARQSGELIGLARGLSDGVKGYLAECKLDPRFQGPACVTRRDGRIEHDSQGIAMAMASRVVEALIDSGVEQIQVLAYGTEVDFCEELGFKPVKGMVPLQLTVDEHRRIGAATPAV